MMHFSVQITNQVRSEMKWWSRRQTEIKIAWKTNIMFHSNISDTLYCLFHSRKKRPAEYNEKKKFWSFFRSFYFSYCSIRWPLSALSNIWTPFLLTFFSLWISMQFKENCRERRKRTTTLMFHRIIWINWIRSLNK